ncbi:MAG: methylene-tetrahydromethanopterin dehydrogenase [Gammaproteobacteria bacterium]|jgi:methylene-tetrahydromethanopterin dehydrogenase
MKDPYLLHIFNPTKNVSPFDVNMAYEADFDAVIPYSNVTVDEVYALTQDTIFSRGATGVKRTGIFIGGREFGLAIDMLNQAKSAMVPPFEVSVFADPSGAITTAAAVIAAVEFWIKKQSGEDLQGKKVHIFGGTGPVGICAGILASLCKADVYITSHRGGDVAQRIADEYNGRYKVNMRGVASGTEEDILTFLGESNVVIGAAKAGIRVLSQAQIAQAKSLIVAADVNAVPPAGIEGIDVNDMGKRLAFSESDAVGIGALAIGNLKYRIHHGLFQMMKEATKPVYLEHLKAFELARSLVSE